MHNYRSNQSALMTTFGTDLRHQYGIFGSKSQTSFTRNAIRAGSDEGRLFSQATICDAIRTVEDIMEFTERYCINGKMICIDFKKAFNAVSRNFLFKTLQAFGFGYSFIRWIHTFYKNISSCVLNNGFYYIALSHKDWELPNARI